MSTSTKKLKITAISKHLFWDVNPLNLDPISSKRIIIERVLKYGLISDWITIYNYYGLNVITSEAKKIKDLDDKSLSFISAMSKTPKKEFLCYIMKQLTPKHWNF